MRSRDENKIFAIFKSTIELSGNVGIAGLKMSTIAKKASLASGTVYLYFENKENLLNELFKFLKQQAIQATFVDVMNLSVKELLYAVWEKTINYRITHKAELVFMEQFLVSPYVGEESKKISETYLVFISQILNRGKAEKIIKNIDNSLLIPLLSGYVKALTSTNGTLIDTVIEQSFELCWEAISLNKND